MKLRFLGHAAFAVELAGLRLVLDPHKPGVLNGKFQLPPIVGPFDAMIITHGHPDHSAWTPALGTSRIIDGACVLGPLRITTRTVCHDQQGGVRMGFSSMMSLEAEGLRLVHTGDIGAWTEADAAWLRGTDVLLVPVGGTYTLDGKGAADLVRAASPRVAIPMHGADLRVDLPLEAVDAFVAAMDVPHRLATELDSGVVGWDAVSTVVLTPP